jgi:hypothetical protein
MPHPKYYLIAGVLALMISNLSRLLTSFSLPDFVDGFLTAIGFTFVLWATIRLIYLSRSKAKGNV